MDLGMKRLDPTVHHLRKAGEVGDVTHLSAKLPQLCRGAARRDDLDMVACKAGGERFEPAFVRKRNQRPAHGNKIGHWSPHQLERRNCQPISPPSAETSPTITSWVVRCGWPRPSIHRLSSTLSWPPRQRKFHGGAPFDRKIAPMPSAVAVVSTPGAR